MESKVETLCKEKEQELLNKYFPLQAPSETLSRDYTPQLPARVQAEYYAFLAHEWKAFSDAPLVLEEEKLRALMTDELSHAINDAYRAAARITPIERITHTNHEDVGRYISLLRLYTRDLLTLMRLDFLEEVTGRHITGKTFEP